jgi:hypothetical protein
MQALLTLNIFSHWLPGALLGAGLFGTLLALPMFFKDDTQPGSAPR